MALPGNIFLKKATSSSVTLEKGSLSGAPFEDGLELPASVCSFQRQIPKCHEVLGRNLLQGFAGEYLFVAAQTAKVRRGLRCLSAALRFTALWRTPTMMGVIACNVGNIGCRKEAGRSTTYHKRKVLSSDQIIFIST